VCCKKRGKINCVLQGEREKVKLSCEETQETICKLLEDRRNMNSVLQRERDEVDCMFAWRETMDKLGVAN
jgi:hypothetical protein